MVGDFALFLSNNRRLSSRVLSFAVVADHQKKERKMEMKKIACAVIFAAASVSAVMAQGEASLAPAPGPASGASAGSVPVLGSLVGASLVSFVAYCLH